MEFSTFLSLRIAREYWTDSPSSPRLWRSTSRRAFQRKRGEERAEEEGERARSSIEKRLLAYALCSALRWKELLSSYSSSHFVSSSSRSTQKDERMLLAKNNLIPFTSWTIWARVPSGHFRAIVKEFVLRQIKIKAILLSRRGKSIE